MKYRVLVDDMFLSGVVFGLVQPGFAPALFKLYLKNISSRIVYMLFLMSPIIFQNLYFTMLLQVY